MKVRDLALTDLQKTRERQQHLSENLTCQWEGIASSLATEAVLSPMTETEMLPPVVTLVEDIAPSIPLVKIPDVRSIALLQPILIF